MMIGRLMLTVCLVCFCANVADAAAVVAKVRGLDSDNPDHDGVATLVYNTGTDSTEITVVITGFDPNTTYGVRFVGGGEVGDSEAITTNPAGNGHWKHTELLANSTDNTEMQIFIGDLVVATGAVENNQP